MADDIVLTKESDFLLCCLYKEYLQRRKNGSLRKDAIKFGKCS